VRLWSTLQPWERRAELAKVHPDLTEGCLIACGRAVPELAPQIRAQRSKEDQLKVVLRYFGDEGHPQPEGPVRYGPAINGEPVIQCPPWGRLPRLEDDTLVENDDLVGGWPYSRAHYDAAGKLHTRGKMTLAGVEKRTGLKRKRAYRLYRQFKHGAVAYDDRGGPRPTPGYGWDPFELRKEPRGFKLIRA
jgi:hypothetical protein